MKRSHISMEKRCAAALLALGHIPYEDAKLMTARQIISLYHWDHGILHAHDGPDEPWNLTPRLIAEHRTKSRRDTGKVAKTKRIDAQWSEFTRRMAQPGRPEKPKSKWASRPFQRKKQ